MYDIVEDLSKLTSIPKELLKNLETKKQSLICSYVLDNVLAKENSVLSIDIGLGTLMIGLEENQIKYKFIPSSDLEHNVRKTVVDEKSPLRQDCEKTLVNRILKAYKDLL